MGIAEQTFKELFMVLGGLALVGLAAIFGCYWIYMKIKKIIKGD